jgi:hypothetical protein
MVSKVYNLALLPILEGAHRDGKLHSIPSAEQTLEVAHVLPGKPGLPKPIIMRFFNRNLRSLVFQHKKAHAPREQHDSSSGGARSRRGGEQGEGSSSQGRFRYPLYEDLTQANLAKMRAIAQDSRVQACWTVSGQIRFKLKDSDQVKKVTSILMPLDDLLK